MFKPLNFLRTQTVEVARADAERIRLIGSSEASAIEAVGKAEAEKMRLKASAYKQYGDAAMLSLVLETLPKVNSLGPSCINKLCNYVTSNLIGQIKQLVNWNSLLIQSKCLYNCCIVG